MAPRRSVKSIISDIDDAISTYELELHTESNRALIIRAKIEALRALRDGTLPATTRHASA